MTLEDLPNLAFRQLVASLDPEIEPSSPRTIDLCLGEARLPFRLSLHPDQDRVVMQAYVTDISMVVGPARAAMLPTLLLINQAALEGRPFGISLDSRDFLYLSRTQRLDKASGDDFLDDLEYLLQQALEMRTLVTHLSLQGGDMEIGEIEEIDSHSETAYEESN